MTWGTIKTGGTAGTRRTKGTVERWKGTARSYQKIGTKGFQD